MVGTAWYDGDLYFKSGPGARKGAQHRGLPGLHRVRGPACTDLVFEGEARCVTDTPMLEALAEISRESGWPVQVEGDAFTAPFSAPSVGPPP